MTDEFLEAAIEEARKGQEAGGIPIGSVLVIDGRIVGRGHNHRVQRGSSILHAGNGLSRKCRSIEGRGLPAVSAVLDIVTL